MSMAVVDDEVVRDLRATVAQELSRQVRRATEEGRALQRTDEELLARRILNH